MHYIIDPYLENVDGHHFFHFSNLIDYADSINLDYKCYGSINLKTDIVGSTIKPYFKSSGKPYIFDTSETICAWKHYRSAEELAANIYNIICKVEEGSSIIIPNGQMVQLIAMPILLKIISAKNKNKKLFIRIFLGNLGIFNSPIFTEFCHKSAIKDTILLVKDTNIDLKIICTTAHSKKLISHDKDISKIIKVLDSLPHQNIKVCEKLLEDKFRKNNTKEKIGSLDFYGIMVDMKNNINHYIEFVKKAQENGFTGNGKIHIDKNMINNMKPHQIERLQSSLKKNSVRLKLIIHENLDETNWFEEMSKLECLVTFSDGRFYEEQIASSHRVKEALMLGVPIITNSDSIYDMHMNHDISTLDRLYIVNQPFEGRDCITAIDSLNRQKSDIESSRRWLNYCDPKRWCKDMLGK